VSKAVEIFDARHCRLGEGPLWHPVRRQLFWFDILAGRLLSIKGNQELAWDFGECVSAAAWVDVDRLLVASETALLLFDIQTDARTVVTLLEADNPATRSNDGRADRQGGFWIGTMGKKAERGAGAIYRYHKGEVRLLFPDWTIPNAICFSPDGRTAYFADTATGVIHSLALDQEGWPVGAPNVFVDLSIQGLSPDGAVIDAEGYLWNAQWGAARIARYDPAGRLVELVDLPATNASCPAFGGPDLGTLFVTSARVEIDSPTVADGRVYAIDHAGAGLSEPKVILPG
jgi:sugar lactone lactonase YvrE